MSRRFLDFERHDGHGLIVRLGGKDANVIDASVTGLRIEKKTMVAVDNEYEIEIFSNDEPEKISKCKAKVVRTDDKFIALKFKRVHYDVSRLIIRNQAEKTNTKPEHF